MEKNERVLCFDSRQLNRHDLETNLLIGAVGFNPDILSNRRLPVLVRFANCGREFDQQPRTANLLQIQACNAAGMFEIATGIAVKIQGVEVFIDQNGSGGVAG